MDGMDEASQPNKVHFVVALGIQLLGWIIGSLVNPLDKDKKDCVFFVRPPLLSFICKLISRQIICWLCIAMIQQIEIMFTEDP